MDRIGHQELRWALIRLEETVDAPRDQSGVDPVQAEWTYDLIAQLKDATALALGAGDGAVLPPDAVRAVARALSDYAPLLDGPARARALTSAQRLRAAPAVRLVVRGVGVDGR